VDVHDPAAFDDLDLDECVRRLGGASIGRIALMANELLVVVPVNYRMVAIEGRRWVVFRTEPGGLLDRPDAHVAFEIDDSDSVRRVGWSVLVQGTLHHVDPDAADVRHRFDPAPWARVPRNRWMAIEPFSITGRRIHVPAD
jgi:hypothetical protein